MMPMVTSGCPIFALSEAIRRSQARASSAPPPRAKPLIAARIGLLHAAIASPSRRPRSEKERISRADSPTLSLMSAPATKARSPAPVRMIAPTSAAIDRCSIVMSNSCKTRELRAFSASGRLIVTTARRSSISVLITPGMESSGPASGRSGMNVRRSEPAGSYPNRYCAHPGGWMHSSGRGFAVGVVILLVLTFGFLAEPARAATNRPTWSTGDFWVYSYSAVALNQTASGSPTLCGRHGIRHAQRDVVFGLQSPGHGQLRIRELDDDFQRRPVYTTDLAIAEISFVITLSGSLTVTIWGNPPQHINWPLTSGDSWASSTDVTLKEIAPNGTATSTYTKLSTTFNVLADTSVTVPAGTFTATPVKETMAGSTSSTINYWPPPAGNAAR